MVVFLGVFFVLLYKAGMLTVHLWRDVSLLNAVPGGVCFTVITPPLGTASAAAQSMQGN